MGKRLGTVELEAILQVVASDEGDGKARADALREHIRTLEDEIEAERRAGNNRALSESHRATENFWKGRNSR